MRVLIDYRPALRERSGVGEYTHQLVASLLRCYPPSSSNGALELTIFSSSWKDRLRHTPELRGAQRRSIVACPSACSTSPGIGSSGRRSETLTGRRFRRHPFARIRCCCPRASAAQVVTIHDLDFLAHPERTQAEIRRDYPASRARSRAGVPAGSSSLRSSPPREVERQLGVAGDRIAICPPGAPDWTPRQGPPANGYILFFGTLEPRKNVGGLLDAYERLIARSRSAKRTAPDSGPRARRKGDRRRPPLARTV